MKSFILLQLTKPGEDAKCFLRLSTDYGVLLKTDPILKKIIPINVRQPSKITRINSFSSLYVIGEDNFFDYLQNYSRKSNLDSEKIISIL